MPHIKHAQSDEARSENLDKSIATADTDLPLGIEYINAPTLAAARVLSPVFIAAITDTKTKKEGRSQETEAKGGVFRVMQTTAIDMIQVVNRRIERTGEPVAHRNFYSMDLQGHYTRPTDTAGWRNLSRDLIAGDTASAAAGNPVMVNPSAAELQTALDNFDTEYTDATNAERIYDIAQENLAVIRTEVDEMLYEIFEQLRFGVRKKDEPSQRRILRAYGFSYAYSPAEQVPPHKPEDFKFVWDDPDLELSCKEPANAEAYEFVYSKEQVDWLELYKGPLPMYKYAPPVGKRWYKVRASNEYGIGAWSDIIEFEIPE